MTHLRGAGGRLSPPLSNCFPAARPKVLYQPQLPTRVVTGQPSKAAPLMQNHA